MNSLNIRFDLLEYKKECQCHHWTGPLSSSVFQHKPDCPKFDHAVELAIMADEIWGNQLKALSDLSDNLNAETISRWMPIETAPKDRWILGWESCEKEDRDLPNGSFNMIRWDQNSNGFVYENDYYAESTHWMELPENPGFAS